MLHIIRGILFVLPLLIASVTDLKNRTIPYSVCIAIAVVGLIDFSPTRLFGLTLALPFYIASLGNRGGMGDVFLIAASCFTLGFGRGVDGLVLALLCFTTYYLAAVAVGKVRGITDKPVSYPLAPFLAVGFITAYFTGGLFFYGYF